ncbi:ANTAR domain-containing protein [Nakamurella deserti]|uniref:ANTAR domain-containing protein n=1 Tax=Nakamurella deserti TaxID=2164074 RepID=UPI000DBE479A|nr:ANTAR domain-containing protein [Nakamurella deserti]
MTAIPRFLSSLQHLRSVVDDGPWSMTTRAAIAVVEAFAGVDGAVICLADDLGMRTPVGVSDGEALLAEQLEYTVGAGPGLDACRRRRQVVAGADLARRWPVFHDALRCGTGYRAVRALPLGGGIGTPPRGVLLLWYRTAAAADRGARSPHQDLTRLASLIGELLTVTAALPRIPARGAGPAERRSAVAQAVGMVMAAHHLAMPDALAVLRGYAYARSALVDDTAVDVVHRRVPLQLLA